MVKPSESAKHAYTYIPPSVQKSMSQHMERAIPAHLKKYQQSGAFIPQHAQKAMAQQMQKNLPSHLQKFVDPYMHQNVFYPNAARSGPAVSSPAPSSAPAKPSNIYGKPGVSSQSFSPAEESQQSSGPSGPPPDPPENPSSDPYDFIMNPGKPPRQPFLLGDGSMTKKIIVLAGGFLLLIMLMIIASSFLSGAGNAQKDRLLGLATTETEIARVSDAAKQKISDRDLLNFSATVKLSVLSTKQEVISALSNRGKKKLKEKEVAIKNPDNDAVLTEGEDNGRFDETYKKLLQKLLSDYQKQLEEVYNSGTKSEKNLAASANDQINLLFKKLQASQE